MADPLADFLARKQTEQSPQNIAPQDGAQPTGVNTDQSTDPLMSFLKNRQSQGQAKQASTLVGPPPEVQGPPTLIDQLSEAPSASLNSGAIDNQGLAFAQGVVNTIVPPAMLDRTVQNSSMLPPAAQNLYNEQSAKLQENMKDHPLAALGGTGLGIVASGILGNGISEAVAPMFEKGLAALTAGKVSEAASSGFTDLALLSTEGGMFSVLNDNPNNFEDAAKSFAKGASVAGALGLTLKGLGAANEFLTEGARVKNLKEVSLAERNVSKIDDAISRAQSLAAQNQAELQVTQSQLHRNQALLTAEPAINERVSLLPNKINDLLDHHISDIHQDVLGKVSLYKDAPIDPLPNYQSAINKLEAAQARTPAAIAQKEAAIKFTKSLMADAFSGAGSEQDVLVGAYKPAKASVPTLYKQNSQFGDLLYNMDFMKDAPSEVKSALRGLQKSNRDLVASVDPTGELSQKLDFEHNLINAKERDGFVQDAPEFFKSYAKNSSDPSVIARWRKFERNLMNRDEVAQSFGKNEAFDAGFKPETLQNPDLKQRADNIRAVIKAEIDPATTDYAVLKQAKQDIPSLQSRVTTLQNSLESNMYKADTRQLSKDKSLYALEQKKMDEPTNAIEALLPGKLRTALHLRRNLNDSVEAMKAPGSVYENSPQLQRNLMMLQKGAIMTGKGTARGLATRLPSLMGLTNSNQPTEEQP